MINSTATTETTNLWQNPDLLQQVLRDLPNAQSEAYLLVDDIRCNGCVLLIERSLTAIPGVISAQVNAISRRARIAFARDTTSLDVILKAMDEIGHSARPLDAAVLNDIRREEARTLLKQMMVADKLLHGEEARVWGDAGYVGIEKRAEHQGREVDWLISMRPGKRRQLPHPVAQAEKSKASVRAKVEHSFFYIKRVFGYSKVRYKGLEKNTNRLYVLAGLSNLLRSQKYLLA